MKQRCKSKKLTPRQEQFCKEYIIDLNATRASIRAGYSEKTASEMGYENLRKPQIVERIAVLKQKSINRVRNETELDISADAVLREMGRIAMFRPEDFASADPETGKIVYVITPENIHKLAGITGLKVRECPPIKVVEAGVEIEREVLEVEFKAEKTRALENLMKHHGLLKEKVEVAGMDKLVAQLHAGRERVRKLNEQRKKEEEAQRRKNDPSA